MPPSPPDPSPAARGEGEEVATLFNQQNERRRQVAPSFLSQGALPLLAGQSGGGLGVPGGHLAGLEDGAVDDVLESVGASIFPDVLDCRSEGGFEAGPILAAEDAEALGGFAPFGNDAGVGAGASTDADVATEVLAGNVQSLLRRIDPGTDEAIP